MKYFFSSDFRPYLSHFGLKWSQDDIFKFFDFFFLISLLGSGRNGSERFFFPLFFGLSKPVSARNEARMIVFKFLNFFPIIFEFSNSGRVGTDWNEIFFLSIFWIFFPIIFVFSNLGRVETDRNEKKVFSIFRLVRTRFGLKWSLDYVL